MRARPSSSVDYDPSQDVEDKKMDEADLDRAYGDVADIQHTMDAISSMTGQQIQMLAAYCENTWDAIDEGTVRRATRRRRRR